MSLLSRGVRATAHPTRRLLKGRQNRFASHGAGQEHAESAESAFHVHGGNESGNESFGAGFYIGVSLIPISLVAYSLSSSSEIPFFTGLINAYREREDRINRENMLNTAALEQAALDRHLFTTKVQERTGPYLEYPEVFNSSSPWNVAAGQGGADMSQLMEHYKKSEKAIEEQRLARMRDGKVTTVYDDTTGGRLPSWIPGVGHKDR